MQANACIQGDLKTEGITLRNPSQLEETFKRTNFLKKRYVPAFLLRIYSEELSWKDEYSNKQFK